jgi:hypothetical protein
MMAAAGACRALSELAEGPDPVAEALRAVGVPRHPERHDEFDTLGLGRHRTTGPWLDEINYRCEPP